MFSGFRTIDNNIVNQLNLIQRELECAFNQASTNTNENFRAGNIYPPVNISSTNDSIDVKLFVANLNPTAIDVTVDNNVLNIRAQKESFVPDGAKPFIKERVDGKVFRQVCMPEDSDPNKITADYKLGVLTINIAKLEKTQPIKVKVH